MSLKKRLNGAAAFAATLAAICAVTLPATPSAVAQSWQGLVALARPDAEAGSLSAIRMMGTLYESPPTRTAATYETALFWREKAAEKGDAGDVMMLCHLYYLGNRPAAQPNYKAARSCYAQAAAKGYAPAEYQLAVMENSGIGGPVDKTDAAKWFKLHASNPKADSEAEQAYYEEIQAGR